MSRRIHRPDFWHRAKARAHFFEPGVLDGPMFRVGTWPDNWKPEGPSMRINGRWMSGARGVHVLYVSRVMRRKYPRENHRETKLRRMHDAIERFLGVEDIPF